MEKQTEVISGMLYLDSPMFKIDKQKVFAASAQFKPNPILKS